MKAVTQNVICTNAVCLFVVFLIFIICIHLDHFSSTSISTLTMLIYRFTINHENKQEQKQNENSP